MSRRILRLGGVLAALGLLLGASLFSAQAQTATWNAEYFNNPSLSGAPAFTRIESQIAWDWDMGSPNADSIAPDNFSARWTADVFFNAGTYRFIGSADDGFRFFLDGDILIDGFSTTFVVPGQSLQIDRELESRVYTLRVEYREATENAFINFRWNPLVTIEEGAFTTVGSFSETWNAQYYNNPDLSGDPALQQNVTSPTIFFGDAAPAGGINADNFSIRFTNTRPYSEGNFRLTVRADDGVRVIINGNTIIDQFGGPANETFTADVFLGNGNSTVVIEYREFTGSAGLSYSLIPLGLAPFPVPDPFAGGAYVEINVPRLNVRNGPAITFVKFAEVTLGQRYPVIGRNVGGSWWFVDLGGGAQGWVAGAFVLPVNVAGVPLVNTVDFTPPEVIDTGGSAVPTNVIPPPAPAAPDPVLSPTGQTTRTAVNANMRRSPTTGSGRLTTIPANTVLPVIARSVNGGWWLVEYLGVQGWVSGSLLVFPSTTNFDAIPVV